MSFEGYYQKLCKKGHLSNIDIYSDEKICHCGQLFVWENLVDQTNDEGETFPLKIKKKDRCDKCGCVKETIYKIPKTKRG